MKAQDKKILKKIKYLSPARLRESPFSTRKDFLVLASSQNPEDIIAGRRYSQKHVMV
uniref:Uncharacterized protein n=1 Tax=Rhizophora mucronata TaxID=61149 RepID=A0A2P2LX27_RHIMU